MTTELPITPPGTVAATVPPTVPPTVPVRTPGLLRSARDFRWYWSGQTLTFVGSQVTATTLPLVAALTLDAGPGGVSAVATASWLPNLVLPLLVGHWLERRSKRRVIVAVDLLRAVALLIVPIAYAADALKTLPRAVQRARHSAASAHPPPQQGAERETPDQRPGRAGTPATPERGACRDRGLFDEF